MSYVCVRQHCLQGQVELVCVPLCAQSLPLPPCPAFVHMVEVLGGY